MRLFFVSVILAAPFVLLGPGEGMAQSLLDKATNLLKDATKATGGAGGGTGGAVDIAGGLREALKIGSERVIGQVGVENGFFGDPKIKIPLPDTLEKVRGPLRLVGLSGQLDELEHSMNRAAEIASAEVLDLFTGAVEEMTIEDAKGILDGPQDAATQYFKEKTSGQLAERMRPFVDDGISRAGVVQAYDQIASKAGSLTLLADPKKDMSDFVLDKAMDGIFHYIAEEEAAIRANPAKRTTELLRQVFGNS